MSREGGLGVVTDAPVVAEVVIDDGPDQGSPSKHGLIAEMEIVEETEDEEEEAVEEEVAVEKPVERKEHEVKISEPEPQQFSEEKAEHTGQYIKHVRSAHSGSKMHLSGSKMHISPSKMGVSQSKMHVSPSRMGVSPSKMHVSPSKMGDSKSKTRVIAPKIEISKPDARGSAAETGEASQEPSSAARGSKGDIDGAGRKMSDMRRSSRMRSLTSQDRMMTMSEEAGGLTRRKFSERRSSARTHGTLTGSIISFRRASAEVDRAKIPRMQNTYRMEAKHPFNSDCVSVILREVIEKECANERYDPSKSPRFAMALSAEIRSRIKLQHFDRYKIIVYVSVCEKQQQSLHSVMRFLWDAEKDSYSTYSFENTTMFVIATAFGVYYE